MTIATRQIQLFPFATNPTPFAGEPVPLEQILAHLNEAMRLSPLDPTTGQPTAYVRGAEHLKVDAIETLTPEALQAHRFNEVVSFLRQARTTGATQEEIAFLLGRLERVAL